MRMYMELNYFNCKYFQEEEFAGSAVICLLPDHRRWAIIGVASWRIACAPTGIERPRMYDKLTSNAAWMRDTINSAT